MTARYKCVTWPEQYPNNRMLTLNRDNAKKVHLNFRQIAVVERNYCEDIEQRPTHVHGSSREPFDTATVFTSQCTVLLDGKKELEVNLQRSARGEPLARQQHSCSHAQN